MVGQVAFRLLNIQKLFGLIIVRIILDALNLGIKFSVLRDRELGGSNNATDSIWTIEVSTLGDSSSEWARPKEQPPGGRGGAGVDDALWFVNLSGWRCVLLCTGLQSL
jgi:hypothetical protein